jgi:hypothetical protein
LEIARVLVRLDQVANSIVNANHGIIILAPPGLSCKSCPRLPYILAVSPRAYARARESLNLAEVKQCQSVLTDRRSSV